MNIKPISEIKKIAEGFAEKLGVTLENVLFKNGDDASLTFVIDKEGGMDLDTCEAFSKAIDAPLEEFDPTYSEPYSLTVTSLGIDRPFKTNKDFEDNLDKEVEVKLQASIKGKKSYEGFLTYFDDKIIRLKINQKDTLTIERKSIAKINKAIKFD